MYDNPSPKEFKQFEITCNVECTVKKIITAKNEDDAISSIDADELFNAVICDGCFIDVVKVKEV